MYEVSATRRFQAFHIAPKTEEAYWTVVDDDFVPVALADDYLRELRFGRDRALGTTKSYAEDLALFYDWADSTRRQVESAAADLGRFMHWLQVTPIARRGASAGKPRSPGRVNHILTSVRELYKHGVAMGSLPGSALEALYVVADDRHHPAVARREDGRLQSVLRPLHRMPQPHRASVDNATDEEFDGLMRACLHWRDRLLLALMFFAGLRHGEALGLRLSDLHFADSSHALGCSYAGPHLHVVRRMNDNGVSAKSRRPRVIPVEPVVIGAFDHYLRRERDVCPEATESDFVFVNLWKAPLGRPMRPSRVYKLIKALGETAELERRIKPHMLRHSAGTAWAAAQGLDAAQVLLGHSSTGSTQVYVHPSDERQRDAVRALSARFEGARRREGGAL